MLTRSINSYSFEHEKNINTSYIRRRQPTSPKDHTMRIQKPESCIANLRGKFNMEEDIHEVQNKTKLYVHASWRVRQDRRITMHRKELTEKTREKSDFYETDCLHREKKNSWMWRMKRSVKDYREYEENIKEREG